MIFPVFFRHAALGEHAPGLGNPLVVYRIAVAADQVVPQWQILAFADQSIAAGRRQPFELFGLARGEMNAVRDKLTPVRVIAALAGFQIQQFAGDSRVIDAVVVLILEFLQAAQTTAVAQRFPFLQIELIEGFAYPERFDFGGDGSSINIRW